MVSQASICNFGWTAPDFSLPATDGKRYRRQDITGPNGALVVFICNHCPYVLAVIDRLVRDVSELQKLGIGAAAICANDATRYPADSFEKMAEFADMNGFCFPYLHDEAQAVARAYDAICTPDFFGFNKEFALQYRGRLDSAGSHSAGAEVKRELFEAMQQVSSGASGPQQQVPAMGCSIKWKVT